MIKYLWTGKQLPTQYSNIALFVVALVVQIHSSMQNASIQKNTHGEMQ